MKIFFRPSWCIKQICCCADSGYVLKTLRPVAFSKCGRLGFILLLLLSPKKEGFGPRSNDGVADALASALPGPFGSRPLVYFLFLIHSVILKL